MYSSRMRNARLLPVYPSMHYMGGVYLAQGGVPGPGVPGPGGYLVPGVYLVRGCVPGPGGCTWS